MKCRFPLCSIFVFFIFQIKMSEGEEEKDEDKEVAKKLGLKIKSYTDIQKFKLDK